MQKTVHEVCQVVVTRNIAIFRFDVLVNEVSNDAAPAFFVKRYLVVVRCAFIEVVFDTVPSVYPDYEFYYEYADEDTGCQVGYIRVKGGEFIESVAFDDGSKEAYEQAFRIWGCEDDFVYDENEGTYKYREDE